MRAREHCRSGGDLRTNIMCLCRRIQNDVVVLNLEYTAAVVHVGRNGTKPQVAERATTPLPANDEQHVGGDLAARIEWTRRCGLAVLEGRKAILSRAYVVLCSLVNPGVQYVSPAISALEFSERDNVGLRIVMYR